VGGRIKHPTRGRECPGKVYFIRRATPRHFSQHGLVPMATPEPTPAPILGTATATATTTVADIDTDIGTETGTGASSWPFMSEVVSMATPDAPLLEHTTGEPLGPAPAPVPGAADEATDTGAPGVGFFRPEGDVSDWTDEELTLLGRLAPVGAGAGAGCAGTSRTQTAPDFEWVKTKVELYNSVQTAWFSGLDKLRTANLGQDFAKALADFVDIAVADPGLSAFDDEPISAELVAQLPCFAQERFVDTLVRVAESVQSYVATLESLVEMLDAVDKTEDDVWEGRIPNDAARAKLKDLTTQMIAKCRCIPRGSGSPVGDSHE
jgi:hypothetical protein